MVSSALAGVKSEKQRVSKLITGFEESNGEFVHSAYYGPSASPGRTMGTTYYDYQHNGSMGRQVSYMPGTQWLHFVWMKGHSPTSDTARKIAYNALNLQVNAWAHNFGAEGGKIFPEGLPGEDIGGYTGCDVRSDGGVVIAYHGGPDETNYGSRAGYDTYIPNAYIVFGAAPLPPNCENVITGKYEIDSKYIWPIVDWSDSSGTSIIHMIAMESQQVVENIQSMIYYRQEANGSWGTCGNFIDSIYSLTPVVRVDPTDHSHMAIVYGKPIYYDGDPNDPCGWTQWQNDVVYVESFDYGKSWSGIINVTDYSEGGTVDISTLVNGLCYTDLSAMFDTGGKLHIVWNTAMRNVAGGEGCDPDPATSRIWHWDDGLGACITIVYDAATPSRDLDPGAFNLSASKPNISECDDKFYVSFTRFGALADGDYNLDNSEGGQANGEIFLTGSTNGGVTWGEAINLTNSPTPDCLSGECDSDHWSSMAMYSSDSVHIQYINDTDAGGSVQGEGAVTESPVKYLSHPCFIPEGYCKVGHTPTSIGYPMHIAPDDLSTGCTASTDTTFIIMLTNTGNEDTDYAISESSDPDNIITEISTSSGPLPAGCGNTVEIEITLGPVADSGVYYADITIATCTGRDIVTIPVQLYVQCKFFVPEKKILETNCWAVAVWNVPRAGLAQRGDEGNMWWESVDEYFMYDNGLILTYADDHSNTTFSVFDGSNSDREFRALSLCSTYTAATYQYAYGVFTTQDTAITGEVEFYIPTNSDTCVLIERIKVTNKSDAQITIHIGEGIDWDIPASDQNHGNIDESRNMVYQYGVDPDYASYHGGASIWHDIPGAAIMQNDIWVYPNSGYDPEEIGDFLATHTGFVNWENADPDSAEDLNCAYVIARNVVLDVDSSYFFCKVKASSITGLTDLQDQIDMGMAWIERHEIECQCGSSGPDCVAGDANGSGGVDIDDVVYLINYIFGGGPPPVQDNCCGDANGSGGVDIDDVVYLINYIFGGGPPPIDIC